MLVPAPSFRHLKPFIGRHFRCPNCTQRDFKFHALFSCHFAGPWTCKTYFHALFSYPFARPWTCKTHFHVLFSYHFARRWTSKTYCQETRVNEPGCKRHWSRKRMMCSARMLCRESHHMCETGHNSIYSFLFSIRPLAICSRLNG